MVKLKLHPGPLGPSLLLASLLGEQFSVHLPQHRWALPSCPSTGHWAACFSPLFWSGCWPPSLEIKASTQGPTPQFCPQPDDTHSFPEMLLLSVFLLRQLAAQLGSCCLLWSVQRDLELGVVCSLRAGEFKYKPSPSQGFVLLPGEAQRQRNRALIFGE